MGLQIQIMYEKLKSFELKYIHAFRSNKQKWQGRGAKLAPTHLNMSPVLEVSPGIGVASLIG